MPAKEDLRDRAVEGRPITQAEASRIAATESDMTGSGPIKGGPAAAAQSLHDKQQNFMEKSGEIARKPADEITKEDAAEVQRAEVSRDLKGELGSVLTRSYQARFLGHRPGKGSTSADIQSLADQNAQAKGE